MNTEKKIRWFIDSFLFAITTVIPRRTGAKEGDYMALTRRALKAMGIDEEKIDEIIALHTETVDGLKADIEKYKEEAASVEDIQKELDDAKAALNAEKGSGWEEKYNNLQKEYEDYKSEQTAKSIHNAKEAAYRELLKDAGVSEKRIATVLKVSDIDELELDESGAVKDADKLTESIKSEWADFIVTEKTQGAETNTPPANNQAPGQRTSRAAQIAAEYHNNLYGTQKGEA